MAAKKKAKKAAAKNTKKAKSAKARVIKARRKVKASSKGYLTAGPHGPGDGEDD